MCARCYATNSAVRMLEFNFVRSCLTGDAGVVDVSVVIAYVD